MEETRPSKATASAFPIVVTGDSKKYQTGLTKREMFAAMAMQGILSNADGQTWDYWAPTRVAKMAVERADALIAVLEAT